MIVMVLGSVVGLACGSLLIPMVMLVLQFKLIDSATIVVPIEFFALFSKFLISITIQHPSHNKPIIDW